MLSLQVLVGPSYPQEVSGVGSTRKKFSFWSYNISFIDQLFGHDGRILVWFFYVFLLTKETKWILNVI